MVILTNRRRICSWSRKSCQSAGTRGTSPFPTPFFLLQIISFYFIALGISSQSQISLSLLSLLLVLSLKAFALVPRLIVPFRLKKCEYLVRWEGYGLERSTWTAEDIVPDIPLKKDFDFYWNTRSLNRRNKLERVDKGLVSDIALGGTSSSSFLI